MAEKRIVLASGSPRRAELMKQMGVEFETMVSNADETLLAGESPRSYVRRLSKLKANTTATQLQGGIIIGCDTTVWVNGSIYGKPKDREDAVKILKELSGKVHKVFSGLCVIDKDSGEKVTTVVMTQVKFRELSDEKVNWYVDTGEPFGKAGAYAIQEKGAMLIEWIDGDYYNVMGLPVETLATILEKMGVTFK